jgi:hypothetical protein
MEIKGKIIEILPAQTGTGARGEWKRQDFILETQEQYPKKVCIENWNDKVDFNIHTVGSIVSVSINIESREFKGKWYTGVRAWKIEGSTQNSSGNLQNKTISDTPLPPPEENDIPNDDAPF